MCQNLRALWIFVLPLLVVLVTPSAFAQSWVSSVTVTTTNTTATINWTTAVPATSRVKYGLTTSYGTFSGLNSNFTTAHSVSLTALTAGTTYHCRVLSADATGVQVTSLDYTFTTTGSVKVSVSPTTATVVSGGSQQFSAQVTNTSNTAVTWWATSGTVSSTGLFTAPTVTTMTTVTVTATSVAAGTTASATVTVKAAATHSVNLSWNASTSPGILGYNIYRAPYTTSCGAFAKLNPALNTGTLYTDTTVADGNDYCYATTAVDSSGGESTYSNIVSNVQIPVL